MERATILSQVPLFAYLNTDQLAEVASKILIRAYGRGEIIFHKDDPGHALYIIHSGKVKITTSSPDGEEIILDILNDGDFFGELSLLDDKPHSASATAMENTQIFLLHREDLLDLIGNNPELTKKILIVLSERIRHVSILLEDAIFLHLPARLSKRLLELGEKHGLKTDSGLKIDLRLTQQDLANFLGASRAAVNKLLHQLQDNGLISIERKYIILRSSQLENNIE